MRMKTPQGYEKIELGGTLSRVPSLKPLMEHIARTCDKSASTGKYLFENGMDIGEVLNAIEVPKWATSVGQIYYFGSAFRRLKALGESGDKAELLKTIHELIILYEMMFGDEQ